MKNQTNTQVGDKVKIKIGQWNEIHDCTITAINGDSCDIAFDSDVLYYDSPRYVMANPYVRSLEGISLKRIFA
jgi:hypothetical protein